MLIITTELHSKYSRAQAVMLCLQRGPIRSLSSQPCYKHHYFTPPSLSLLYFSKERTTQTPSPHEVKPERRRWGGGKVNRRGRGWKHERPGSEKCKSSTQTVYSTTGKKGALQLLPKYAQRTGMLHGAHSKRNKDSTVSGSLSPVLPHPHIINWKIPDICCHFSSFFG